MEVRLIRSFLSPWLVVSAVAHALLALGTAGAGLIAGGGIRSGDGFGGGSIELEIAGRDDGPAHGAHVPSARLFSEPAVPATPMPVDAVDGAEIANEDEGDLPVEAAVATLEPRPPVESESPVEGAADPEPEAPRPIPGRAETDEIDAPDATEAATPGEHDAPSGTGADESTAGPPAGDAANLILGSAGFGGDTIRTRQALLPGDIVCTDPVAGTWRAQKFRPTGRSWVRFILRIRREPGNRLSGTITSRIWTGTAGSPRPGPCTAFGFDNTWRMSAVGSVAGDQMTFGARGGVRLIRQDCPQSDHRYAPDHFRGTVFALREVFQSRNNDGAYDIDEPYTFRRVSCE